MIKLSERMQAIADRLTPGAVVADIGTDHGYIPIYLHENQLAKHIIMTDLNEGPLSRAKQNIEGLGYFELSDFRMGSGLVPLMQGEADSVVIAGMGGDLTVDILKNDAEKSGSIGRFVLQPRTQASFLRRWLFDNGFAIIDECLAKEGRRICEIIVAVPECSRCGLEAEVFSDPVDFSVGPLLFKNNDPLLSEFLDIKIAAAKLVIDSLTKSKSSSKGDLMEFWTHRVHMLCERKGQI